MADGGRLPAPIRPLVSGLIDRLRPMTLNAVFLVLVVLALAAALRAAS